MSFLPKSPLDLLCDTAFRVVEASLGDHRIAGAALAVFDAEGSIACRWAGCRTRLPEPEAMTRDTWFDLASLTKVIATTTEVMHLVEEGQADLDDMMSHHLPDMWQYDAGHPLRALTLRQLLSHQSGLPAVAPVYTWGNDAAQLKTLILHRDWPLGAPVYSDINFQILGLLIERLRGRPLSALQRGEGLAFGPRPAGECAATEVCGWRGRLIRGEVHDENAFALGGAAGHAGLFGTIDGVAGFGVGLLQGRTMSTAALEEMCRPHAEDRALGWQVRHRAWSGGSLCSPRTIGHTGFTGTGLWIDLERHIGWTLLTNRVHPSRHIETGIQDLRRRVGNIVAAASSI